MAGNIGSPLCAELNRIANNGVYPDRDDFLEEQGAANVWAGTTGLGLLGALNYIVDPTRTDNNYKGLTAVCNELAGTTGLSDVDALRTIGHAAEVLLRGTTPQSAVFTTDAATPRYNYPGYVYLPGIAGQYISTPDAASLDVTGDLDIRVQVAMDSWTSSVETKTLLSKDNLSAGTRSYSLDINTIGSGSGLILTWTTDGSTGTRSVKNSTVAIPFTAGTTGWVRAALDVNNGASGNTVTFYTSTDGITWTTLGTPVVTAGTTSVYAGTSEIQIGAVANQQLPAGKFYRAQIFASIDGTDKRLDVDLTTNVTSATYDQFTATTGQLCTINGQNTLTNMGKAGALLPITVGSSLAADSNDAKFLDHTGTNYVYLPGVNSNVMGVPSSAALQITGDLDIRVDVALENYNSTDSQNMLLGKITTAGSVKEYALQYEYSTLSGQLALYWRTSGGTTRTARATASTSYLVNNTRAILRATLDVNNGAGQYEVKFFSSVNNGTTWVQIGSTVTGSTGATDIGASTGDIGIGGFPIPISGTFTTAGKFYDAQIYSDITGTTKVLDVDTSVITTGAATSFTAVTGQTVTINRSTSGRKTVAVTQPTWLFGTDDYMEVNNRYMAHSTSDENYVYLTNATGNYLSIVDNPPLDITTDLDIQVKVAMNDWTAADRRYLLSKYVLTGNQCSYTLRLETSGVLQLVWTPDGNNASAIAKASTVAPTVADGATLWVRATLDVDNGASGNDVKFYTSTNGTTWTQLGSTVTTAGVTSIYSGTAPVEIGSFNGGVVGATSSPLSFYRAIIKNGIDGTTVLDANAAVITLPSQTTFTDSSSNAYTVTINKSGVGTFVSTGNYLYLPGIASNYASTPDAAALDITGDIDLRVKVALDDWTPAAQQVLMTKQQSGTQRSYALRVSTAGLLEMLWSVDGTTLIATTSTVATGLTDGATKWVRATLDVDNGASGNTVTFFLSDNGITWTQLGATVVTAGVTSIYSSTSVLEVGGRFLGVNDSARGKFFRAQVLNGIGGTVVFDANFEGSITSLNQASFTESSSNAATVTINRSGSTYRSAGVIDAGYLYPGATNTFSNSTIDYLTIDANTNMTVLMFRRKWNTSPNYRVAFSKGGYAVLNYETGNTIYAQLSQTTGAVTSFSTTWTPGALQYNGFVVDRTLGKLTTLTTNGGATPTSISGNVVFHATTSLTIAQNDDAELVAFAVFRSVLTAKNISDIYNYFNGRD